MLLLAASSVALPTGAEPQRHSIEFGLDSFKALAHTWLDLMQSGTSSTVSAGSSSAAAEPPRANGNQRQPLGLVVSGGGFRTMTAGMAFARAMSQSFDEVEGSSWADVTHLGGNSGGQWFASQFALSTPFFDAVTRKGADGEYRSLEDFFAEWGRQYAKGLYFSPPPEVHVYNNCAGEEGVGGLISDALTEAFKSLGWALETANFPTDDWAVYVEDMMRNSIPGFEQLRYNETRSALPDAALIQQLALPPDAWVGHSRQTSQRVALRQPEDGRPVGATVPLAHVAKAASSQRGTDGWLAPALGGSPLLSKAPYSCSCEWTYWNACPGQPKGASWLSPVASDDGSACFAHCCGRGRDASAASDAPARTIEVSARFASPAGTKVRDVTAASSAAVGAAASPTLVKLALKRALHGATETLEMLANGGSGEAQAALGLKAWLSGEADAAQFDSQVDEFVESCFPFGLQELGVGIPLEPAEELPEDETRAWSPTYRAIDGVYVDNTALAMTIATMIADCEAGDESLACTNKELDVIVVNDGDSSNPGSNGLGDFFSEEKGGAAHPVGKYKTAEDFPYTTVPSAHIFAEAYPSNWVTYHQTDIVDTIAAVGDTSAVAVMAAGAAPAAGITMGVGTTVGAAASVASALASSAAASAASAMEGTKAAGGRRRRLASSEVGASRSNFTNSTLTTINNPQWGVKEGYTVRLLAFCINYPNNPMQMLQNGGVGIDDDPMVLPALTAATFFSHLYAPIAEKESELAAKHLKAWLEARAQRKS